MQLHIVYTETGMFLTKQAAVSWRCFQDAHPDFKASLGPWGSGEVTEFLADHHPDVYPIAEEQVAALLSSTTDTCPVTFRVIDNAA